jgi:hypothetical protein
MTYVLWIIQGLLAALFLFAGGVKLVLPIDQMTAGAPVSLPGWFLRFLGMDSPRHFPHSAGTDTDSCLRFGDHHDRGHDNYLERRTLSAMRDLACGGAPGRVCRLRPMAAIEALSCRRGLMTVGPTVG